MKTIVYKGMHQDLRHSLLFYKMTVFMFKKIVACCVGKSGLKINLDTLLDKEILKNTILG